MSTVNFTPSQPQPSAALPCVGFGKTDGPWIGIPARRIDAGQTISLSTPVGAIGSVRLWILLPSPLINGPGVHPGGATLVELPGVGELKLWWYSGYSGIVWEGDGGNPRLHIEVPGLPGPQWISLCLTWDAEAGCLEGYLNGTPMRLPGTRVPRWPQPEPTREARLSGLGWKIAGLSIESRHLTADEVLAGVPSIYRGAMDHLLGASPAGTFEADRWRGKELGWLPLAGANDVAQWKMEGPGNVGFYDGWMRLSSREPGSTGPTGHIVYWCDSEWPSDFLLEFETRIIGRKGLNILFFSAKGRNGQDLFDPALKARTGVFGEYTGGDINCYHASYYAHTPEVQGRSTSNLRKNHGFYLVDNGPVGIPPGSSEIHRVALLRTGHSIRLAVDGRCLIDWHDDGHQYGPLLGGGKIGFRQMKWTVAEYRHLKISTPCASAVSQPICCSH